MGAAMATVMSTEKQENEKKMSVKRSSNISK